MGALPMKGTAGTMTPQKRLRQIRAALFPILVIGNIGLDFIPTGVVYYLGGIPVLVGPGIAARKREQDGNRQDH